MVERSLVTRNIGVQLPILTPLFQGRLKVGHLTLNQAMMVRFHPLKPIQQQKNQPFLTGSSCMVCHAILLLLFANVN
jgi:hypothetical protein